MTKTIEERVDVVWTPETAHGPGAWVVMYDAPRSKHLRRIESFPDASAAYYFRLGFVAALREGEQ